MRITRQLLATVFTACLVVAGCTSDSNPPGAASSATASSASAAAPARPMRILVSNDDGVAAPGIDALVQALAAEPAMEVTVVAPATNQSGSGGKTTAGTLSAAKATTASGYPATAVQGYPADSVDYGLSTVLTSPPDLVMSGVNAGQNLGPVVDISGTVGAARAGAQHGIPAIAVSAGVGDPIDYRSAVEAAITWLRAHRDELLASPAPPTSVANLNVPTCAAGAVRGEVTVPADATAPADVALAPADCTSTMPPGATDVAAFHAGFATLSEVAVRPSAPSGG